MTTAASINLPGIKLKTAKSVAISYKIKAEIMEGLDGVDERLGKLVADGKMKPMVIDRTEIVEVAFKDFITKLHAQLDKVEKG